MIDSPAIRRARLDLEQALTDQMWRDAFPTCSEDGCERPGEVLDLCKGHARRLGVRS